MKIETVGRVYKTNDLSIFKALEGNRSVIEQRKKKVKESIVKYGWIEGSCILVNEKYEVIDGQARLEACRDLGLPIYFTVGEGIGIKECAAVNVSTKWQTMDYINMYASSGNINYKYLKILCEKYPDMSVPAITNISKLNVGGTHTNFKEGNFRMSEKKFEQTDRAIQYIRSCKNPNIQVDGYKRLYESSIGTLYIAYENDPHLFDATRLRDKLLKYKGLLVANNSDGIMSKLSDIYNFRSKSSYVDFRTILINIQKNHYKWVAEYKEN